MSTYGSKHWHIKLANTNDEDMLKLHSHTFNVTIYVSRVASAGDIILYAWCSDLETEQRSIK